MGPPPGSQVWEVWGVGPGGFACLTSPQEMLLLLGALLYEPLQSLLLCPGVPFLT